MMMTLPRSAQSKMRLLHLIMILLVKIAVAKEEEGGEGVGLAEVRGVPLVAPGQRYRIAARGSQQGGGRWKREVEAEEEEEDDGTAKAQSHPTG